MTIDDLKKNNLILFECISGSRAYGLDTPESDTDIKGVFYLPKKDFYGLNYVAQVANETNDIVYYELGRFIELLLKNNPSALELLASPKECILFSHPVMDHFNLSLFLSKLAKETFAGYAMTQIKKAKGLNKKIHNPLPEERKTILDFCYILENEQGVPVIEWLESRQYKQEYCGLVNIPHVKGLYALYYDEQKKFHYKGIVKSLSANNVNVSSILKTEIAIAHLYCNLEGYSSYCKDYLAYWNWVNNRNEIRYQTNQAHGADYDSKNMMHTVRLLQIADEIASKGKLTVRCQNRDELLKIKQGAFSYDELFEKVNKLHEHIEEMFVFCELPEKPNRTEIEVILVETREILYR